MLAEGVHGSDSFFVRAKSRHSGPPKACRINSVWHCKEVRARERQNAALPRPFLKPRGQLFQIDAIEADLVLVPPCLVEVE